MQRVHNIIIMILMISARTLWWTAAIPCSEQASESGKDHLHLFIRFQGQCHEIFASGFFHESSLPKPLKITLGSFHIFSKICKSRCQRHRRQVTHQCQRHRWCTLNCEYLHEFSKNSKRRGPCGILSCLGETDS